MRLEPFKNPILGSWAAFKSGLGRTYFVAGKMRNADKEYPVSCWRHEMRGTQEKYNIGERKKSSSFIVVFQTIYLFLFKVEVN